jgi:hypothetical protein
MKALVYSVPMHIVKSAISKRHSLPADAVFSSVWVEPDGKTVSFFVQSKDFDDVPDGQILKNPVLLT